MIRRTDKLERLIYRMDKLANPAPVRPPRNTPIKTRKHVRIHPTRVCMTCGGPISYWSGRQCEGCYRAEARLKYEEKVALRELKMRLAREAKL